MAVFVAACAERKLDTMRVRVTVAVATPEGVRSGSSVIELERRTQGMGAGGPLGPGVVNKIKGIAPIVDLGRYGTVIAGLTTFNSRNVGRVYIRDLSTVVIMAIDANYNGRDARSYPKLDGPVTAGNWLPEFIWRLAGTGDPKTAKPVLRSEFETILGSGVKLKKSDH